jgi:hypothetical protein
MGELPTANMTSFISRSENKSPVLIHGQVCYKKPNLRVEGKKVRYDAIKPFDTILNYADSQLWLLDRDTAVKHPSGRLSIKFDARE